MMSEADRRKAAQWLVQAEKNRKPIVQLSKTFPDITIDDAYSISALATELRVAEGHKVIGNKIGLTSKVVQAQLGVDQPVEGDQGGVVLAVEVDAALDLVGDVPRQREVGLAEIALDHLVAGLLDGADVGREVARHQDVQLDDLEENLLDGLSDSWDVDRDEG